VTTLTLDAAYRYLIGLGGDGRGECPCGYPERRLAPSYLDVAGVGGRHGFVIVCPACGALTGAIIER
jgi:hypothetical protein